MPFFSLIIPTYNRKHRLHAPLNAALAQTFTDFEVILVDDGSTDQTEKWLNENYNDARIRYFYKENEERSIARNFGIRRAKGQFIFFLDSDDELLPNHFKVLHEAIQKYPKIHRFATRFYIRTDAGSLLPSRITLPEGKYDYRILLQGNPFNSMLCLRREGTPIQPFPPEFRIGEDWIFMMRNLWEHPVFMIDQTTAISNDHPERTMRQDNPKIIKAQLACIQFLCQEFDLSQEEQYLLEAHGYEFAAIHSYLDYDEKAMRDYLSKAVSRVGWNKKRLSLWLKSWIGRRNIERWSR